MINFESNTPIHLTISVFDLDNIANILIEPTKYNWFNAHLLRLCAKADADNLLKLAHVFPDVVAAYLIYKFGSIPLLFREVIKDWQPYEVMMTPHIKGDKNA